MSIHPSAVVHAEARIDHSVEVGPFAVIGDNVEIGKNCRIAPFVHLKYCRIGEGSKIGAHTIIGGAPQIHGWKEVPSRVVVGKDCYIHELVTIHRSKEENGETLIGDRCMIMSNTHIAHDCRLENDVIFSTFAGLSGYVEIEEFAIISGQAGIHQFVRIGAYAMVGGLCRVIQDVAPFMLAEGSPAVIRSTNAVGLKRKGFSKETRLNIKRACKILFQSGYSLKTAKEKLAELEDGEGEIKRILVFMNNSRRGFTGI